VASATLSHNVLNGNTATGLLISTFSIATVQNNVLNGNGQYGIFIGPALPPPDDLEFTGNTALANGMVDLFDSQTPDCKGTVWTGNTFFTANQSCIH